ncbi:MAG TPA: protein-glutamate O-methyltransferase CheR [Methyloceanibacter sp.]
MTRGEFAYFQALLKERSGLSLAEDNRGLLEARLRPLLKEFDQTSLSELAASSIRPEAEYLRSRIAQAVTVQESYFFRDKAPFQYFAETILPAVVKARRATGHIRIWCAAAATGQEPYSLAMLIAEHKAELDGYNVEIYATDYAKDALAKARKGLYSQFEVQRGLPVALLVKYFDKREKSWELKADIRAMVRFSEHNLAREAPSRGFDAIFCRNVLIYFDEATKRKVLGDLANALALDGWLVLGSAETTRGLCGDFVSAVEAPCGVFRLVKHATTNEAGEAACCVEAEASVLSGIVKRHAGAER